MPTGPVMPVPAEPRRGPGWVPAAAATVSGVQPQRLAGGPGQPLTRQGQPDSASVSEMDLRIVERKTAYRAVSTTMPVATDHASTSGSVTLGSVRSVGGTFPVTLVHAVASSLRSRNTPPVIAIVVISRALEPSPFLPL